MRDETKEDLSALVDDEVRREELRFLIRRVAGDPDAAAQLGRYYLIRDVLRRDVGASGAGLGGRVAAAIAAEPVPARRAGGLYGRIARPAAGMAIAASAALFVVTLWPRADAPAPTSSNQTAATAPAGESSGGDSPIRFASDLDLRPATVSRGSAESQWDRLDPEVQQKLNGLLVNHSEHASAGQFGGVLPYSRIAGHDEAVD